MKLKDLLMESKAIDSLILRKYIDDINIRTNRFKKLCTGFVDATELKTNNMAAYLTVGNLDNIANDEKSVDAYIAKQGSGVVAVQVNGTKLDLYSPSAKGYAKYKDTCSGDSRISKELTGVKISFKSQGNNIVEMVDLDSLGEYAKLIRQNGLVIAAWGNDIQKTTDHKFGTYVVLDGDDNTYLVAKDRDKLPTNYQKA